MRQRKKEETNMNIKHTAKSLLKPITISVLTATILKLMSYTYTTKDMVIISASTLIGLNIFLFYKLLKKEDINYVM